MMTSISVNDLFKHSVASGSTSIERVLWVDISGSEVFVIDILSDDSFPQMRNVKAITDGIVTGSITSLKEDPWSRVVIEEELSDKDKTIREKAWAVISSLVAPEMEPSIYDSRVRGRLVQQAAERFQMHKMTVYKYLAQ